MEQVDRCLGCGLSWRERAQGFVGRKNKRTRGGIIYPHEIRNLPLEEGTNPPDNNKRAVATGKWVFLSFQHTTMPVHTPNQLSAILMRYGLAPWMFSEGETTCNQLRLHSSGHSCQQRKTFRVIWCMIIYFVLFFICTFYFNLFILLVIFPPLLFLSYSLSCLLFLSCGSASHAPWSYFCFKTQNSIPVPCISSCHAWFLHMKVQNYKPYKFFSSSWYFKSVSFMSHMVSWVGC